MPEDHILLNCTLAELANYAVTMTLDEGVKQFAPNYTLTFDGQGYCVLIASDATQIVVKYFIEEDGIMLVGIPDIEERARVQHAADVAFGQSAQNN